MDEEKQKNTRLEAAAKSLLERAEQTMKRRNLAETTFGKRSVGDVKAVARLRSDRLVIRTAVKLERYIDLCDAEDAKRAAARAAHEARA